MGDPYHRYPAAAAATDRGNISTPSFPGYLPSEAASVASHYVDMQLSSPDVQQRDPGIYSAYSTSTSGVYPEPHLGGVPAGATLRAYPSSLADPSSVAQRWDAPVGVDSNVRVHPDSRYGGISAGATIRGYSSALEVPNLVVHRHDASGISSSAGVYHEPTHGAVSSENTIRNYSSPPEARNLVGQRRDASVGMSPSPGLYPETSLGALSAGPCMKGYPPLKDPNLVGHRQDGPLGISPGIPGAVDEKPASIRISGSPPLAAEESNILFVDGLPTDCTRREVSHLFRLFTGYKDIKIIFKEPRHSGDRAMVLCFVEFDDSKCAMTAMLALQGYRFDDKKPESPALRIQYAHFPFRLQADRDDQKAQ